MSKWVCTLLIASALPCLGFADVDTGDLKFSLGLIGTKLTGTVADLHGQAAGTGIGAFITYVNSKQLEFEVGYLASSHDKLIHTEIPIGFNYKFSEIKSLIPYLSSGVALISNSFEDQGSNYRSSGYGVYGGAGVNKQISKVFIIDGQLRYLYGFEQTVQRPNGDKVTALNSTATGMVRIIYLVDFE